MENTQTAEKKIGVRSIAVIIALAMAITGIIRVGDMPRFTVLTAQAVVCIYILVFNFVNPKDKKTELFQMTYYAYAIVEAFRAAMLNTTGVNPWIGALARFLLACLAGACILAVQRLAKKDGAKVATAVMALETVLYLVFIFGFKGVMHGRINRFLPLIGVLIAGSLSLYAMSYSEWDEQAQKSEKEWKGIVYFGVCLGVAVVAMIIKSFI